MNKTVATGTAGAVIAAALVGALDYFWALKMPAELAAVIAGALTIIIDYLVRWLPKPPATTASVLLPLLFALPLLGACGFTSEGDALRGAVAARGAEAYDAGLDNATWFICNAASIGSINRRFGGDPAIYLAFCGAADKRVPPRVVP